jgi:hypothetical protein
MPALRVAPTKTVAVPPARTPVGVGVLVQVSTVIVLLPEVIVVAPIGRVIEKVEVPRPVMVKAAAATVPATAGRVQLPVAVRVLAGVSTTVPTTVGPDATLPKFISVAFTIAIGVIIVAVAVAVAETCAKVTALKESRTIVVANNLNKFFIII